MAEAQRKLTSDASRSILENELAKHKSGYTVSDITNRFSSACQDLAVGQLVKDEDFSLWDAVQALEVMDPKMDSGCLEPGEDASIEYTVAQSLKPEEVLWIMDEILCRETAWLQGFALFQTVFTSNHILHLLLSCKHLGRRPHFFKDDDQPPDPFRKYTHLCLYAFCLATIIQCDMTIELVTSQQFYEEEDLNTQTYGLQLGSMITDEECLSLLGKAISWLQNLPVPTQEEADIHKALIARLELRRSFMALFMYANISEFDCTIFDLCNHIRATPDLGTKCQDAFDAKAYRKLAIGGPTRTPRSIPILDTVAYLELLIDEYRAGCEINELGETPTAEALQLFLWRFASRSPSPSALGRAKIQSQLFHQDRPSAPDSTQRVDAEVMELGIIDLDTLEHKAGEASPGSKARRDFETYDRFRNLASQLVDEGYRALCQNRCRIRRCLINSVQHGNSLHKTMRETPPASLSSDVLETLSAHFTVPKAAWRIVWSVLLGFEQDVFERWEIGHMYDFMRRVLHLHSAKFLETASEEHYPPNVGHALRYEAHANMSVRHISAALALLFTALYRLGFWRSSKDISSTNAVKMWRLRIDPFKVGNGLNQEAIEAALNKPVPSRLREELSLQQILQSAETDLDAGQKEVQESLNEPKHAVKAILGVPTEHWLADYWRTQLTGLKRVTVKAKLVTAQLRRVVLPEESDKQGGYVDGIKDGWNVNVHLPNGEERLQAAKGNMREAWWVIPAVEVTEPKPDDVQPGGARREQSKSA